MKSLIIFIVISAVPSVLFGVIDFNGNGISEIWELQYKGAVTNDIDSDGDGICDQMESEESSGLPGFGLISAISMLAIAAFARKK